jgi:hypothetical protein
VRWGIEGKISVATRREGEINNLWRGGVVNYEVSEKDVYWAKIMMIGGHGD